ncbi:MAG TPA: serine/threonine-protein kinase [Polyangiaceae bacterium]|nr:serine/threonine-protein kinase [Polyangiaceae bacterium]
MTATGDEDLERFQARVGQNLRGKWKLDGLLGVGGMAAVYSATHRIGRRGAIKILHPEVAVSKELKARFEQEAHAVSKLGHRGAVEVLDVDTTEDGAPFMVMELLEGESLGQRAFRLGGIPERELLGYVVELCDVLDAAHAMGIIHRDIKPDNLFVTSAGQLKVLDFGIARVRGAAGSVKTRTGAMLGTTSYMAPEQIHGRAIDGRADLYSVGATMFRLLAKRKIHEAESDAELLVKMGTEPAPLLLTVAPSVDPRIAKIVDRALAFRVDDRYPDAKTMREDLRAVLDGRDPPFATSVGARMDAPTRTDLGGAAAFAAAAAALPAGPTTVDPARSFGSEPTAAPASLPGNVLGGAPAAAMSAPSPPAMWSGAAAPGATTVDPMAFNAPVAIARAPGEPDSKRGLVPLIVIGGAALVLGIGVTSYFMLQGSSSKQATSHRATDTEMGDDQEKTDGSASASASAESSAEPAPSSTAAEPGDGTKRPVLRPPSTSKTSTSPTATSPAPTAKTTTSPTSTPTSTAPTAKPPTTTTSAPKPGKDKDKGPKEHGNGHSKDK